MGLGADAADARGDIREFLDATALRELLESPKLRDDHVCVSHISLVVEEKIDSSMSFEAGHGIDRDFLHGALLIAQS